MNELADDTIAAVAVEDSIEDRIADAVVAFTTQNAPKQLRNAAQHVLEFFTDKRQPEGGFSVKISGGQITEIVVIDVVALTKIEREIQQDITEDLVDIVNAAVITADSDAEAQRAATTGAFEPFKENN